MVITYEQGIEKYGTKYLLQKAVRDGVIFKKEKGIYSDNKYEAELAIITAKYPRAIFTLDSAFYYHGLTDVIPEKYYMATDRDATKISDKRVKQVFENSSILELGVTTMSYNNTTIRIYSKERLLVELLRHKNLMPFDYYKEILLNYREIIHDLDIPAIQDYAYEVPKSSKIFEALQLEVL